MTLLNWRSILCQFSRRSSNQNYLDRLKAHSTVTSGEKYRKKGKLLPRERINQLLDHGSAFLELSPIAGDDLYGKDLIRHGGLITGIGLVEGKLCMIMCNEYTVKGGSIYPVGLKKYLRAQEMASQCSLINIHLTESGGAALPYQSDLFVEGGRNFFNIAQMSSEGVPQMTVVFGSCTAGAAYVPAMSDENIMVDKQGYVFLGGPPLVQAATGAVVSPEELGGATVHCTESGVSDHFANSDQGAISIARKLIRNSNFDNNRSSHLFLSDEDNFVQEINSPDSEATNDHLNFEGRFVIGRIADSESFAEFKAQYGRDLTAGFGRIMEIPCGFVASNGVLSKEGALKATSFVQICSQRKLPLVFIQDVKELEFFADPKALALRGNAICNLMRVVACSQVPKITLIVGGSHGVENFALCGRSFSPHFLFTWPTSKVSLCSSESLAKTGLDRETVARVQSEESCVFASARLWDDGVIEPQHSRRVLALSLQCAMNRSQTDACKLPVIRP